MRRRIVLRRRDGIVALLSLTLALGSGCASSPASNAAEARDADVRDAVENALRREPAVERVPIQVDVENGLVVLYGTVDSETESQRAEAVARAAPGVRDVDNRLRVGAESPELPVDALRAPSP